MENKEVIKILEDLKHNLMVGELKKYQKKLIRKRIYKAIKKIQSQESSRVEKLDEMPDYETANEVKEVASGTHTPSNGSNKTHPDNQSPREQSKKSDKSDETTENLRCGLVSPNHSAPTDTLKELEGLEEEMNQIMKDWGNVKIFDLPEEVSNKLCEIIEGVEQILEKAEKELKDIGLNIDVRVPQYKEIISKCKEILEK